MGSISHFTCTTSFNDAKSVAKSTLYTQSMARGKCQSTYITVIMSSIHAVVDPDLQIGGGGGRSPKKFFSALRASFWMINKRGGWAGPPRPLLWIPTDLYCEFEIFKCSFFQ